MRGNVSCMTRDLIVKLSYLCIKRLVGFKKYLHGVSDAGSRLIFKFRSGTHGLNEELGRHRGREGKVECTLCGAECESVVHVLWECPAYSNCRLTFLEKLQEINILTLIRLII